MRAAPCISLALLATFTFSCKSEIRKSADHYLEHRDLRSLNRVVELMSLPVDTTEVIDLLGQPISTGIDIRYFADSVGPTGCTVGAAFVFDRHGKVFHKWVGELCE